MKLLLLLTSWSHMMHHVEATASWSNVEGALRVHWSYWSRIPVHAEAAAYPQSTLNGTPAYSSLDGCASCETYIHSSSGGIRICWEDCWAQAPSEEVKPPLHPTPLSTYMFIWYSKVGFILDTAGCLHHSPACLVLFLMPWVVAGR